MKPGELSETLAREYGYLDAKHGMGYNPRPFGFSRAYDEGRRDWREFTLKSEREAVSYREGLNHGWN